MRHFLLAAWLWNLRTAIGSSTAAAYEPAMGGIRVLMTYGGQQLPAVLLCLIGMIAYAGETAVASEKTQVAAILGGQAWPAAAPEFVSAVRRISELGGKFAFDDAGGNLVGVDLTSDRVSLSDVDVPCLLALPHLRQLQLSGVGITDAGVRQVGSIAGLTELSFLDVRMDNAGLEHLTHLANLHVA